MGKLGRVVPGSGRKQGHTVPHRSLELRPPRSWDLAFEREHTFVVDRAQRVDDRCEVERSLWRQPAVAVRDVDVGERGASPTDGLWNRGLLVLALERVDNNPDG